MSAPTALAEAAGKGAKNRYAALVRNDNGGLEVRWFASPGDAVAACAQRARALGQAVDTAPRRKWARQPRRPGQPYRIADLATKLGISAPSLREAVKAGEIEFLKHGPKLWLIPEAEAKRIERMGLQHVRAMRRLGLDPVTGR